MTCCSIAVSDLPFAMASQETLPLSFDLSEVLQVSESISNATAQLIQLDTGQDYAAGRQGTVAVQGAVLTQVVTGLSPRKRYRLVIQFQAAIGKIWAPYLLIDCPE